jgi:uncharacterized lipoprotein YbaY
MRQIHPRTSFPAVLPTPVPTAIDPTTRVTVDLRDIAEARHPSLTAEDRLRRQLAEARLAVDAVMEELSILIDQRENLKVALGTLVGADNPARVLDDKTVVPWGFYDDEL